MADISIRMHFLSVMKKLFQLLLKLKPQRQQLPINISTPAPAPAPAPSSSSSTTATLNPPENSLVVVGGHVRQLPSSVIGEVVAQHLDLTMIVMGFCFTSAIGMALQSDRSGHTLLPSASQHLLSLLIVFALSSVSVARFINFNKFPFTVRTLELLGVFFAVAAFYFAITIPLPLPLKCTTWALFALSMLAILVCNFLF